jgi:hypothetical protein
VSRGLERLDEGLYAVHAPHRFYGLHLGTRMTVLRLADGSVWLHSPIALEPMLKAEIDALGEVAHIVCPNLYHHSYARPWAEAYPKARVHGPAGLAGKRPDLRIDAELGPVAWGDDLVPLKIAGSMLRETVFLHPRTQTLISSDLTENFDTSPHWPTRMYLKASGIHGRVGWSRALRLLYTNRKRARASIDQLLEHRFERVVLAHGQILASGGHEAVRETFHFLYLGL